MDTPEGARLVAASAIAGGGLATSSINADDSYVTMQVTTEHSGTIASDTPVYDAQTGQASTAVSYQSPSQTYHVEAGYDAHGQLAYGQYALTPLAGDPTLVSVDEVRTIRVQDGFFAVYDTEGLVDASESGGYPTLTEVLGDVDGGGGDGDTGVGIAGTGSLTDGLVLDGPPEPGGLGAFGAGGPYTLVSERVETTGGHVRVVAELAPGPGMAGAAGGPRVRYERTYRRQGAQYVLAETVTEATEGAGRMRHVLRFREVRWHTNEARDRARRDRQGRGGAGRPEGVPSGTAGVVPSSLCEEMLGGFDARPENCHPGGGGGGGGTYDPCPPVAGGANVAWVHGINSDPSTWGPVQRDTRVRSRIRCTVAVDAELLPDLQNKGHYGHAFQTDVLQNAVTSAPQGQFVFVGHSQGGVISRRAAHQLYGNGQNGLAPGKVRGVISVGTPHRGANVVRNLPSINAQAAQAKQHYQACAARLLTCAPVSRLIHSGTLWQMSASAGTHAAFDLAPGSTEINRVNGQAEHFQRYGIQHYVHKRWVWARIVGDHLALDGGKKAVGTIDVVYGAFAAGGIIAALFKGYGVSAYLLSEVAYLIRFDAWYHSVTAGSDKTDGVVEGRSQVYPNALRNFTARQPTSHTGETKSEKSAQEIRAVMREQLGVTDLIR